MCNNFPVFFVYNLTLDITLIYRHAGAHLIDLFMDHPRTFSLWLSDDLHASQDIEFAQSKAPQDDIESLGRKKANRANYK